MATYRLKRKTFGFSVGSLFGKNNFAKAGQLFKSTSSLGTQEAFKAGAKGVGEIAKGGAKALGTTALGIGGVAAGGMMLNDQLTKTDDN